MNITEYISAAISVVSFVGGLAAYMIGLRIRNEIATNNEAIQKQLADLRADIADDGKILSVVNGRYVRTDLFQQAHANINDKFASLKEIIEANMERLESALDRQIDSLKERIK